MFRSLACLRHSILLLALGIAACSNSTSPDANPTPPPPPPPTPTVTLSIDPASITLIAGSTATVTASITRGGGFTGPVTITGTGAPSNVTITGGTIATGATSIPVTVTTTAAVAAGAANLSITGTAAGVTITPSTVALTVTSAAIIGQIGTGLEGEFAGDEYGTAIALSANGSRVVIGAPYNKGNGSNAGHARVFERSGNTWVKLGADIDAEAAEDRYGNSVAISDNGTRVAVGSYLNDGGGNNSGSVRVFDYIGIAWTQVGGDIDGAPGFGSGWGVAMNASGSRVVIGGPGVGSERGQVQVYQLSGSTWTQLGATLSGSSEFGHAVSMSDDGNRIAVSFPSATGSRLPGSTNVYDWNGSAWVQAGATIAGEAIADFSGASISLSADGSMLAIGASQNAGGGVSGGGARGGHVRVHRFASGTWTQVGADIDGPLALSSGGGFGQSVSLSADGTRLIAAGDGGGRQSIGVYVLSGSTWTKSATPDFGTGGRMGAVAISADGRTAAAGEVYFRGAAGAASGVVRLYGLQ